MEDFIPCTTLDQSKTLIELGLNPNSADMYYKRTNEEPEYKLNLGSNIAINYNLFSYRNGHVIPCWSVGKLLELMPSCIILNKHDAYLRFRKDNNNLYEYCYSSPFDYILYKGDTVLKGAYDMICYLLKNNYI